MSLSPSCLSIADTARADRLEWPDLGPLRWPYLAFAREELLLHREPAVCLTTEGVCWEYDCRRFLITDVIAGTWRKPAGDLEEIPPGPWRHVTACACEACRLGNV
jgi:hypothetical protein